MDNANDDELLTYGTRAVNVNAEYVPEHLSLVRAVYEHAHSSLWNGGVSEYQLAWRTASTPRIRHYGYAMQPLQVDVTFYHLRHLPSGWHP